MKRSDRAQQDQTLRREWRVCTEDYSAYPDNYKFATSGTGKKYVKPLMIQGVAAMTEHLEQLAAQTRWLTLAGTDAVR